MTAGAEQCRLLVHDLDQGAERAFRESDEIAGREIVECGEALGSRHE